MKETLRNKKNKNIEKKKSIHCQTNEIIIKSIELARNQKKIKMNFYEK